MGIENASDAPANPIARIASVTKKADRIILHPVAGARLRVVVALVAVSTEGTSSRQWQVLCKKAGPLFASNLGLFPIWMRLPIRAVRGHSVIELVGCSIERKY